jgi:hypothetical protein
MELPPEDFESLIGLTKKGRIFNMLIMIDIFSPNLELLGKI